MSLFAIDPKQWKKRLLVATPTRGSVRIEWCHHRYGQVIPVNWEASNFDLNTFALGYWIDDAYNLIVNHALGLGVEWVLFIEDDVLIPFDTFKRMAQYMEDGSIPVVSGLYSAKSNPPEPLLFRGRGNGCFKDWTLGDKVWVDGVPMGCLLVHMSIFKWMADHVESYKLPSGETVAKIFITPRFIDWDKKTLTYRRMEGTQDLYFFDRLMQQDVLKKCGFSMPDEQYQFLCDTEIQCLHIDPNGLVYPIGGWRDPDKQAG